MLQKQQAHEPSVHTALDFKRRIHPKLKKRSNSGMIFLDSARPQEETISRPGIDRMDDSDTMDIEKDPLRQSNNTGETYRRLSSDDEPDSFTSLSDSTSTSSSSDESDTDDEEIMIWGSRMFGVGLPPTISNAKVQQVHKIDCFRPPSTPPHSSQPRLLSSPPPKLRIKLSPQKQKMLVEPAKTTTNIVPGKKRNPAKKKKKKKKTLTPECGTVPYRIDGGDIVKKKKKKKKLNVEKGNSMNVIMPRLGANKYDYMDEADDQRKRDEERRIRKESRPLTAAEVRKILGEDDFVGGVEQNWVRRSMRQPSRAILTSKPVKTLVEGLKKNHPDMVVLKMKKYINDPAAPCVALDAALDALEENTNCEALYIQNFNEGMRDEQILHLLRILQSPSCNVWCLNVGEIYNVKMSTWGKFTKGLRRTKVTHMYASEHTITTEMKDEIRTTIRENRKKHTMHVDPNNLDVIVQCTHCWWNPINAKKLRPYLQNRGYEYILNDGEAQGLRGSHSEAPST